MSQSLPILSSLESVLPREPRIIPDFRASERGTRDPVNYRFFVGLAPLRADITEAATDVLLKPLKNLSLFCYFVGLHVRQLRGRLIGMQ